MGEIVTLTAHSDVPMHVDPAGHGFNCDELLERHLG
jgi:hypothetical protein